MKTSLDNWRIQIAKLENENEWCLVSNPKIDQCSRSQNEILRNSANDYAEYKNCGVLRRMIRIKDCCDYGINESEITLNCIIDPAEFSED